MFPVEPGTAEHAEVSHAFYASLNKVRDGVVTLCEISRIQNKLLWREYAAERKRVSSQNGGDPNEAHMWHGTRTAAPADLYREHECAFDPRFSNQGLWGRGSYFAKDSTGKR